MALRSIDLMIGDWVYAPHAPKTPVRVDAIYSCGISYIMPDKTSGISTIVNPIPLTPEILEKNGFIRDGESWWYMDFRIVLSEAKGVALVCGRQVRFNYVHELQHALRLCGIEKELKI